jgi:hypothetical protein
MTAAFSETQQGRAHQAPISQVPQVPVGQAPKAPMGQRGPLSPRYARRLARSEGYLHAASRKFLEGTAFRSPVEAVESGAKSVLEWCDCLALARLDYRVNAHLYGE